MSEHTEKIIDMLFLVNMFNLILNLTVDSVLFSLMRSYILFLFLLLMIFWVVKYSYKCLSKIFDDIFKIDIRRR